MPVVRSPDAVVHEIHGACFVSYATPRSGSKELCASVGLEARLADGTRIVPPWAD